MYIRKTIHILLLMFSAVVTSCMHTGRSCQPVHDEINSIYYWKTVLELDSADIAFIRRHDIGRIYLRMFDVDKARYPEDKPVRDKTEPVASVSVGEDMYNLLQDSLADIEFVPVVYITLDALKAMHSYEGVLASNIVTRVRNMCLYNALTHVQEFQIDCDWTISTEKSFFALCDSIKQCLRDADLDWRLSSTVRLHQLSREAPPVDSGVLMVYNTGEFNDPDTFNSIIETDDIRPYLDDLSSYPVHLDVAYPTYSWQLLFRGRYFKGLINNLDLSDTAHFVRCGANTYSVKGVVRYNNMFISDGDFIREEKSDYKSVLDAKLLIEKELYRTPHSNIIYHLDSNNLSNYTSDEIDNIFSTAH